MAFKVFQSVVSRIRDAAGIDFGITDNTGTIIASTIEDEIGTTNDECSEFLLSNAMYVEKPGLTMKKIEINGRHDYVLYLLSDSAECSKYAELIAISLENAKLYYDEKYDRNNFMKNVLLGNILPGDITIRAKELRVKIDCRRIVYLIRTEKTRELYAYNVIQSLFPNNNKDFIILLDDQNTVLVKELKEREDKEEIYKKARIIIDTLNSELMIKAKVGIGTEAQSLRDVARSYKDAQTALKIGQIFETEKSIVDYNHLGIGRLIYQLPTTLCRLFLNEVFKEGVLETIDSETMMTIQKFFENNLNVSETSRQLFIHRNTLVYRLDKIQKITGMDLRKFDDAIYFKVAMMVKRYLDEVSK
ncbi:MAG: PucR family transcriptional regulator [Clostridiaceae bacterium]|nr:PucR family transcriptional regulator [Clostridiaceae bacterium]